MAAYGRNTTIGEFMRQNGYTNIDDIEMGEIADALNSAGYKGKRDTDTFLSKISATIDSIRDSAIELDRTVTGMTKHWMAVDEAASKYARTIATTKKGLEDLREATIKNVVKGRIGYDFGLNAEDLLTAQTNFMKSIGRNVKLGFDDSQTIAAITSLYSELGDQSAMFDAFDKMGVSMEGVGKHMGKMYSEAAKSGISLEKYAENVRHGLEMANKYTFRDGLKGMEAMARRAAAIRMDMQQIESFAGSFDNIENALSNTAKLQVLGGQFANGADALGLLNDSLNDMESLQKRMEGFTAGIGMLNKQTGEVEISTFNRLRLQQFAKVTGQDYGKVMEVARRQAMRGEIEAQLNTATNPALDEDFKELIRNTATFKNGKAGVTIGNDFKELSELTAKDQETLIAESRTQTEDIKQIAKDVRSLADIRKNIRKQYEATSAQIESPMGRGLKNLTGGFANLGWNFPLQAIGVISIFNTLIGGLGKSFGYLKGIKNIWARGGESAVEDSAHSILRRRANKAVGKKVAEEAAETAIKKGATRHVTTNVLERGIKGIGLKLGGKKGVEIAGRLATGAAKGAGFGIIGAAGNIATDLLVESGKMKKGGTGHMAMKAGSTALEGAALGAVIGSVIPGLGNAVGAAVGAVAGAAIGAVKVQKARSEQVIDSQLQAIGIQRQGNYSKSKLDKIDEALQTGKMSNSLRRKLLREGDADIVNQINSVKDAKNKEREEKREKRRERREERREEIKKQIGVAHFDVGTAVFNGVSRGFGPANIAKKAINTAAKLNPIQILKAAKKEDGSSPELKMLDSIKKAGKFAANLAEKRVENTERLKVDINGTIKLETPKGETFDIMKEIKNNPKLLSQLTQAIIKQMNTEQYGGYRSDRTFGNNPI